MCKKGIMVKFGTWEQVLLLPIVTNMTRMGFKGTELYGQYTLCRDFMSPFNEANLWVSGLERNFSGHSDR